MKITAILDPAKVRAALVRRGLSGAEFARIANLSGPTVSAIFAGRPISPSTARKVSAALAAAAPLSLEDLVA